ncbi:outer membrane protein [Aestuariivirga sp. YIM B02566]|uniref:Porin family protein n=1 Tax=Taklimakanibacter albus TaxID=2800327 RepID=A0ACC5R5G3_9HYPH|nr:outer membrane beta-barrel protein [Aestuariivirga sp. YIM B02566]MBK1867756.1 porin family protein [Aestuariivirga sp. YIM B02566]
MKSFKLVLLATAMTAGLAVAAQAADVTPPEPETVTQEQYQAMGFYLRGDLGWSFLDWGDKDNAFAVGGGVGYQFNDYLRSDVRVDWSGDYEVGDNADASLTTVLGNMYVDWKNDSIFTPYIGAGAGYGWVSADDGLSDDGFTYALMGGVSVDMSQSIALDFGYRYRELMISGENPADHSALAGIRFKF